MKKKTNCLICEQGGGPLGHLEDIMQRMEYLDDKPHQLFSAIDRASHLVKLNDEQEFLKMVQLGLDNAHKMLIFAVKVGCEPCEKCNFKGSLLKEVE